MATSGKNIILFAPAFFGYDKLIKEEMERQGAYVNLYDERPFQSLLGRLILRLNMGWLCSWFIERYFHKILSPVVKNLDYVVFINPEAVTSSILRAIKFKNSKVKVIVYMWDSFDNKKSSSKLIADADSFFSFDPVDANKFGIQFLPLFYSPVYASLRDIKDYKYDLSFVGTAHSERYQLVKKITSTFERTYIFLYTPSKLVFLYKKYFCNELAGLAYKDVSSVAMSRESVVDVIGKSRAVIDINHPSQVGLTMRTIEMLGAGRKLITTNTEVKKYDFYNSSNILVYNAGLSAADIYDFLNMPYVKIDESTYSRYSLNSWVIRLFRN